MCELYKLRGKANLGGYGETPYPPMIVLPQMPLMPLEIFLPQIPRIITDFLTIELF